MTKLLGSAAFVATLGLLSTPVLADEFPDSSTILAPDVIPLLDDAKAEQSEAAEAALSALAEEALAMQEQSAAARPRVLAAESLEQLRRQVLRSNDRVEAMNKPLSLCYPSSINLCLNGRFLVVAVYENQYAAPGVYLTAGARQLTTSAGYFWFFDPVNMEVPIKMVNGCYSNPSSHWVFAAGLSNFGVGIGVKDMITGVTKYYNNLPGSVFNTIIDQATPWPCP